MSQIKADLEGLEQRLKRSLPSVARFHAHGRNDEDHATQQESAVLGAEVNLAVNNGQWAILMFHYFVDKPQSSIEYRKKDFEKFIELLAKSNVQVLPVHEVYHKFKTTRTATNRASEN